VFPPDTPAASSSALRRATPFSEALRQSTRPATVAKRVWTISRLDRDGGHFPPKPGVVLTANNTAILPAFPAAAGTVASVAKIFTDVVLTAFRHNAVSLFHLTAISIASRIAAGNATYTVPSILTRCSA
jgi:hypothetical protein